jgi:transposase
VEYANTNKANPKNDIATASKDINTVLFVKFLNIFLDMMNLDESLKGNYVVMDNCTIHKPKPMIRKIESMEYKAVRLPSYLTEVNSIEEAWSVTKGKLKRHRLLTEENLRN